MAQPLDALDAVARERQERELVVLLEVLDRAQLVVLQVQFLHMREGVKVLDAADVEPVEAQRLLAQQRVDLGVRHVHAVLQ